MHKLVFGKAQDTLWMSHGVFRVISPINHKFFAQLFWLMCINLSGLTKSNATKLTSFNCWQQFILALSIRLFASWSEPSCWLADGTYSQHPHMTHPNGEIKQSETEIRSSTFFLISLRKSSMGLIPMMHYKPC